MNFNRCKICNSTDQSIRWASKTKCNNCYQKKYVEENKLKRKCNTCEATESKGSWYRGPKCSKCYSKDLYKKGRSRSLGQKYCHLIGASKKKNFILDIDRDTYKKLIDKTCHYCNRNLYELTGHSLDRIEPDKGYVLENVLPCCGDCNTIKMNILTVEETEEVLKLIKKLRNTEGSPWILNKEDSLGVK